MYCIMYIAQADKHTSSAHPTLNKVGWMGRGRNFFTWILV